MMFICFRLTPGTLGRLAWQENCAIAPTRKNSHGHSWACLAYACVRKLLIIMLFLAWAGLGIALVRLDCVVVTFFRITEGTLGGLLGWKISLLSRLGKSHM